ncbi:MAG: cation:proton antiporter, partial [Acholeplasmatales bacterium]|nr:cation:proton antiporter [Acholeplasmatales bacterium]
MELLLKVSIVLIVGFIGGKLARRLKLPDVSGYLVLGIILGPSLGFIFKDFSGVITNTDQEKLKFIGEIALAFIAFSIGSEFNFKVMKKIGKKINTIAVFEVLVAVLSVFVVLFFIPKPAPIMNGYQPFSKNNLAFGLILASMSAATAPAATLMVMRQYRSYGPVTKTVLPVTALDDIYGIVVFGFAISIAQMLVSPSNAKLVLVIFKPFIEVFGSLLLGG